MEKTPGTITIAYSDEVQRSAQAVCIDTENQDKYKCIYAGEGTITDEFYIPAVMANQVQKGNVYLITNPDDYKSGMYSQMTGEELPQ